MGAGRAVVTPQEMAAAAELVEDLDGWTTRHGRIAMVAAALADVREGATLPGVRQMVTVNEHVHGALWMEHPDLQEKVRGHVRQRWAQALERAGMRPLGWPPITVTFWRWAPLPYRPALTLRPDRGDGPSGMEQSENPEQADAVRLTISGPAVLA